MEAGDQAPIFRLLRAVIDQARYEVNIQHLPRIAPALPQQFEQSLDLIARRV